MLLQYHVHGGLGEMYYCNLEKFMSFGSNWWPGRPPGTWPGSKTGPCGRASLQAVS